MSAVIYCICICHAACTHNKYSSFIIVKRKAMAFPPPFNFQNNKIHSPLGETAVQCESDNTGNCLHCHTLRARPIHPHVSH